MTVQINDVVDDVKPISHRFVVVPRWFFSVKKNQLDSCFNNQSFINDVINYKYFDWCFYVMILHADWISVEVFLILIRQRLTCITGDEI